ncbi:unnamed protein product, partial [Didymodactylos carnosus]
PYPGQSPYQGQPPYPGQGPYPPYQQPVPPRKKGLSLGCVIAIILTVFAVPVIVVAILILLAPEIEKASNNLTTIKSAEMARGVKDLKADGVTSVFKPSESALHCVVNLTAPTTTTKVKIVWNLVESAEADVGNIKEIEYITAKRENVLDLYLTAQRPWPVGKYKVDLYLNDTFDRSVEFRVEA